MLERPRRLSASLTPLIASPLGEWAVIAALAAVGLVLRLHGYTGTPRINENIDEYAWAWSGQSLIRDHVPTAWSLLPAYHHSFPIVEPHTGRTLPGVRPWLDHPPVFSLLIGGVALLGGETSFAEVTPRVIRLPVIGLSIVTLVLAYLLGRRLAGRGVATVAMALLAVAPGAVLASRSVESEALLAPLLLVALILLHRISREPGRAGRLDLALLLPVCALAPLVKVPGIAVALVASGVLAAGRRIVAAALCAAAGAGGLLLFAAYGALIDWQRFTAVWAAQAGRHRSLLGAFEFITAPAGVTDATHLHDGWWLLGWLAIGTVLLGRTQQHDLLLAWPVVVYATLMVLFADPIAVMLFGWYREAVLAIVYLLAATLVVDMVRTPTPSKVLLVLAVAGGTALTALGGAEGSPPRWPIAITLAIPVVCLLPALATAAWPSSRRALHTAQWVAGLTVAAVLAANLLQTLRLYSISSYL